MIKKIEIVDNCGRDDDGFFVCIAQIIGISKSFLIAYKDIDKPHINVDIQDLPFINNLIINLGYQSKELIINMSILQYSGAYTVDIYLEDDGCIWLRDMILRYDKKIYLCKLCDKYKYSIPNDWIENVKEDKIYDGLRRNMNATQKIKELSEKYIETKDTKNIDEICEILNIVIMSEKELINFYWSDIKVNGMNQLCIIEGRHGYDHAYYPIDEDLYWRMKEVVERFI